MWPSESDLEPLDSIIDRMNPTSGFPYPMKSAVNKGFPKLVGDPWIGAYTKNGYWYKLSWGGKEEWEEIASEMWYRNELLVDSRSFDFYCAATERNADNEKEESGKLELLVAKNIRGEALGIALCAKNVLAQFSNVGLVFVQEDFRHVGIGSVLMKEVMKNKTHIAFNAIAYLLPTIHKFGLESKSMRTFGRVRVKNPSGFPSLEKELSGVTFLFGNQINTDEKWSRLTDYAEACTNERRNWKAFIGDNDESYQLVAAFQNSGDCVGLSILREVSNEDGQVPDLLVAPLYAASFCIAEVLLCKLLKKHYNPEDDYDFDVDYLAIYRRSINFFVFSSCESLMLPLLSKLTGSDGKLEKDRLTFQSCSNFLLPAINHEMIFAMGDPSIFLC